MRSGCERFIGLGYELGADGSSGKIDCIHLVLAVLDDLQIPHPSIKGSWYEGRRKMVFRDLYDWGERIANPVYDGDVVLIPEQDWTFGVTWQRGILYVNQALMAVNWSPVALLPKLHAFRYCPTKSS